MSFVPKGWRVAFVYGLVLVLGAGQARAQGEKKAGEDVKAEHAQLGAGEERATGHTQHPDAQWFPEAAFGLFIHWGLSSVKAMNISWPMIPGRPLAARDLSAAEVERVVRERDYNLDGKPPGVTPNQYWEMAKSFDPGPAYDPDKWIRAAKEAGFTYAVMTAKHHEGFALWPSAFGDFNTKTYAKGQDLVAPFVEACRRHGLKVGLYFSGPDWWFDREYYSFLYGRAGRRNPGLPSLDADLQPRATEKNAEEIAEHQAAYAALVRGQIEELLTRYGRIDVLWFDGKPAVPDPESVITVARIRELQPGIVINPRMHGNGDYVVWEREQNLPKERPKVEWAEFCSTWTRSWAHEEIPFRAPGNILGKLALLRSWRVNYLLGVGPMSNGEMAPGVYENMAAVAAWMKGHRASIHGTGPLPDGETASSPATARERVRYLFAAPKFREGGYGYPEEQLPAADETLTLSGAPRPKAVVLMASGQALPFTYTDKTLTVPVPAALRSKLVDVVQVTLP